MLRRPGQSVDAEIQRKHERAPASVLSEWHGPERPHRRRPRQSGAPAQHPSPEGPRLGDTGDRVHREMVMLNPRRSCDELLNPPGARESVFRRRRYQHRCAAQLGSPGPDRPQRTTRTHHLRVGGAGEGEETNPGSGGRGRESQTRREAARGGPFRPQSFIR